MLQWLPVAAALHHFPQGCEFGLSECAFEVQVKLQPRNLKEVRQHQFDLKARRLHTLPTKKLGTALDDFQDGHRVKIGVAFAVQSPKFGDLRVHPGRVPYQLKTDTTKTEIAERFNITAP